MKKIIAEDSDRNRFYLEYDGSAPKDKRCHITGDGVDIRTSNIPDGMILLRDHMSARGRLIVSYAGLERGTIVRRKHGNEMVSDIT